MPKKRVATDLVKKGAVSLLTVGLISLSTSPAFCEPPKATVVSPKKFDSVKVLSVSLNKKNLAALTNNLAGSPAERQKFLSNPLMYSEIFLGGKLDTQSEAKVNNLQGQLASGFCCEGCGCDMPYRTVDMKSNVR